MLMMLHQKTEFDMNKLIKYGFWTAVGILSMDWEEFQAFGEVLTTPGRTHLIGTNQWIERLTQLGKREFQYFREMILDEIHKTQEQFRLSKRRHPKI